VALAPVHHGRDLNRRGAGPTLSPDQEDMMDSSESFWRRPFSRAEIDSIRRATRDESGVFADMWKLLRKVGRNLPFAEDVLAAFYCATDPATERRVKIVLVGAIAYFVMPFDVIPDVLPFLGYTDDAALLAAAIASVAGAIKPEHREKARDALASTQP
jgi:uncharacterized membrane protein YkvA (DUF1232 family)